MGVQSLRYVQSIRQLQLGGELPRFGNSRNSKCPKSIAEEAERKAFTLGSPLRWRGWRRRKINEAPVRWAVSTNSVGSLTIMETGGGRGGEYYKTAEIVLVF